MIRIIHLSDTHLGYKQYQSEIRREDFYNSFESIINDAINYNIDAVIHSGDLFDTRTPTLDDIIKTTKILQKLSCKNIPFFAIVGNHEMKQNNQWIDLFEQMGLAIRLNNTPQLINKNKIKVSIYGIDNISPQKYYSINFNEFEKSTSNHSILVMHQLLYPLVKNARFSYIDFLTKFNIDFKLLLLGDSHNYECKNLAFFSKNKKLYRQCCLTYSGSTEICNISESKYRCYNFITITKDKINVHKKIIKTRNFIIFNINCNKYNSYDKIYNKIKEEINLNDKIKNSVVILKITGSNDILINMNDIEKLIINKNPCIVRILDERNYNSNIINKNITSENDLLNESPEDIIDSKLREIKYFKYGEEIDYIIRKENIPNIKFNEIIENKIKSYVNSKYNNKYLNIKNINAIDSNIVYYDNIKKKNEIKKYILEEKMDI